MAFDKIRTFNTFRINLRLDAVSLNVFGYVVPPFDSAQGASLMAGISGAEANALSEERQRRVEGPGVETSCPLICPTAFVQQMGKKFLMQVLVVILLALLSGCGGGSAGTGGRTLTGTVETAQAQPLPGVTVTLAETGDSAVTDANGSFVIVADEIPPNANLVMHAPNLDITVPVVAGPDGGSAVRVSVTINPATQSAAVRVLDVHAAIQGVCDYYFLNDGRIIRQQIPLANESLCTVKVQMYGDGRPLVRRIAVEVRACSKNAPWRFVEDDQIRPTSYGQVNFFFSNDSQHCLYRVAAPYQDPANAPIYTIIQTLTAQREGINN